jgi:hypothetical protein
LGQKSWRATTINEEKQQVVPHCDGSYLKWRKSSFSEYTSCVEAAPYGDGRVALRDSKDPAAGFLLYEAAEWRAFLAGVRNGEFDYLDRE